MKKMSLLVLALIVVLPGCCKKNKPTQSTRRSSIQKYADIPNDKDIVAIDSDDLDLDIDLDDLGDLDIDDLDLDDLDFDDLDDELESYLKTPEDEGDILEIDEIDEEYSWIDAQTDDEFKKLYFSFNHYGIRPDQKEAVAYDIEQVKQLLSEGGNSQPTVVLEGHACQEGSPVYNVALSEKRAKNVADLFVAAGIDRNLIKVVGRGQECPLVNGSREERAPNRRVEVRVIYT